MNPAQKVEFDRERAQEYNLDIRKAIPGYEALHAMAQSWLSTNLATSANLLIVGSGTGMELISYCQNNPDWLFIGADPAPEMMTIARQALKDRDLLARVQLHLGYVDTLPPTKLMDAATLILVMHFLPDDGSKLKLLQHIARHLKPGAEFVLADLYGDRSSANFAKYKQAWKNLYFSQLEAQARTKAEQNFAASINNSIHFVTEARIIELLETAGFSNISRFYNAFLFGGWTAKYQGS